MSNALKRIAIGVTIVGFVGGIILGNKLPIYNYYYDEEQFNGYLMALVWVMTALYVIHLYALSVVVANQDEIRSDIERLSQKTPHSSDSTSPNPTSNTKANLSALSQYSSQASDGWRCPKCGKTNSNTNRICKDCGYNK